MVRYAYVFVSLCLLLVMIVDIGVFCGGGEKEKQESRKRNTVDKDKASSRSKKIRFDVQQGDVTVSTASSLCSSENAVDIPSSDPTVREAVLPILPHLGSLIHSTRMVRSMWTTTMTNAIFKILCRR